MVPPAPFPWGHLPTMIFAWFSFLIYLNLLSALLRQRNIKLLTNSAVYTLLLFGSIGDICMFFHTELVMRPRKYRWFWFFDENTPNWIAYYSYFMLSWFRLVLLLNYIPLAANRFTAFVVPVYYRKFWKPQNILFYTVIIWIIALLLTLFIFLYPKLVDLELVLLDNGILQIMTNDLFLKDAIEVAVLSLGICIICGILYVTGGIASKKITGIANGVEKKMFLCCVLASIPLLLESLKAWCLLYGAATNNTTIILLVTELHFYWSGIMTSVQCWTILLITPSARQLMLRDGLLRFCVWSQNERVSIIVSYSS